MKKIMIGDFCSFVVGRKRVKGICVGYDRCRPVMLLEDWSYFDEKHYMIPVPRLWDIVFLGKKDVPANAMDGYVSEAEKLKKQRALAKEREAESFCSYDSSKFIF